MSERNILKETLESNEEFRNILVGLALKAAIGGQLLKRFY